MHSYSQILARLFVFFSFIIIFSQNFATAQVSISLYPVSLRLTLNPGDVYSGQITVINPNNFPFIIKTETENLAGGPEGNVDLIGEREVPYGLASWVSFRDKEATLQPQERRPFEFTISVPRNAQPGGHYGALLFRGVTDANIQGSGVGISGRVGTVMLVEISGDINRSGEIVEVSGPSFLDHGPIAISFKIANSGNTYFSPTGTISFSNLLGKHEATWDSRVVFPGFDRTFKAEWNQRYFIGPVRVSVNMNIPSGPSLGIKSITIWVFPWQEFLVIAAGVTATIFLLRFLKKNFRIVRVDKNSNSISGSELNNGS